MKGNKARAALAAAAAAAVLLSACGTGQLGETQVFNPNQTVGESQTAAPQEGQPVEQLRLAGDYQKLVQEEAGPWSNTLDENTAACRTLLYDPLYTLAPDFTPEGVLAAGASTADHLTFTITLDAGASFWDGTALDAAAVDDSLTRAMAEGSAWQKRLSGIQSHRAVGEDTLEIVLSEPNAQFLSLLTFPVARWDGSSWQGTGRYRLASMDWEDALLTPNPTRAGAQALPQVQLVKLPRAEVASYSMKIGELDGLCTDQPQGGSSFAIPRNDLFFLGINGGQEPLDDPAVRQALSQALDRTVLAAGAQSAGCLPSSLPFPPQWAQVQGQTVQAQDQEAARQVLAPQGAEPVELTLLYPTGSQTKEQLARLVQSQLEEAGAVVQLDGRTYEEYLSALRSGSYDLYLGQVLLTDDMDIRPLLSQSSSCGFGARPSETLTQAVDQWRQGSGELSAVCDAFSQDLPFLPLLYRQGALEFSRQLELSAQPSPSDPFYQMEEWNPTRSAASEK